MKIWQLPKSNQPVRKPILYWQAWRGNTLIENNNSVALLSHKYGNGVIYKAVR
jgi:hypothetical protein